jgi:hypothetical protein
MNKISSSILISINLTYCTLLNGFGKKILLNSCLMGTGVGKIFT